RRRVVTGRRGQSAPLVGMLWWCGKSGGQDGGLPSRLRVGRRSSQRNIESPPQPSINIGPSGHPASRPADERVKLAAPPFGGRIAFVRPYASVERLIVGVPRRDPMPLLLSPRRERFLAWILFVATLAGPSAARAQRTLRSPIEVGF